MCGAHMEHRLLPVRHGRLVLAARMDHGQVRLHWQAATPALFKLCALNCAVKQAPHKRLCRGVGILTRTVAGRPLLFIIVFKANCKAVHGGPAMPVWLGLRRRRGAVFCLRCPALLCIWFGECLILYQIQGFQD